MYRKSDYQSERRSESRARGRVAARARHWPLAQDAAPDDVLGGLARQGIHGRIFDAQRPHAGRRQAHVRLRRRRQRRARLHAQRRDAAAAPWRMDFATPCSVTLTFTRGTRYCTVEDVKAGNAEVLSSCHRLRSRDVAMRPVEGQGRGRTQRHDRVPGAGSRRQARHVDPRGLAGARDRRRRRHRQGR